ncbi:MAG: hypothetical protein ABFS32_10985 [Bacteroidota bacterium]
MKRIIILMLLVFTLEGCEVVSPDIIDEEGIGEVTKDDVLAAIDEYKTSLYELGASNSDVGGGRIAELNEGDSATIHTKDELVDSNMNVGYDGEWLDMSVLVLNFAEAITSSSYTLGEETLFYDLIDDPGIWGWAIYDSTKVILNYSKEGLYLRVIDDSLIQTFFFKYVAPGSQGRVTVVGDRLIKILRLWEDVGPEENALYIEDFIEKTGLSMWRSNGNYMMSSRVTSEDGGLYTIMSSNSGDKSFVIANYVINDVPLHINSALNVAYDFKYVDVFDSFNEGGVLFLNGEVVQMPLTMNARPAYHGAETFVLTGTKELIGWSTSLGVEEANIITEITSKDIKSNITNLLANAELNGTFYDYSLEVEVILNDFSNLLYLDY